MIYKVGQRANFSKTISESDVYLYAGIIGDFNPLHVDSEIAKNMYFGKRIAHGMLTASFISSVIAGQLPGPGTIYIQQICKFLAPVYIGDTITAEVIIDELIEKNKAKLSTKVINQKHDVVVEGEAIVKLPQEEK